MRALASNISKRLTIGSVLICADNSGVKKIKIIGVIGKSGAYTKNPRAGVGDVIVGSVIDGEPEKIKTKVRAMIIRQRAPIRRANGMRVIFSDNAAILVNDLLLPIATEIKGVIAREVVERNIKIAEVAEKVV
ncbi:MAG: 50S ribosomal protein L14 [Candidatus Micrarchaeota archaeon]|nr:MAG: 50S ribosomal protein L14 [Candidatus Micrarchaeota archaeon]